MKHLKGRRELKVEEAHRRCCLNRRFCASGAGRCKPQLFVRYSAVVPAGRYKFGLWIKHQQYCNHQLQLQADEFQMPKLQQALFVSTNSKDPGIFKKYCYWRSKNSFHIF
jgi:hypothetical protein